MENHSNNKPLEYKFFCYNGCPKYVLVVADRFATGEVDMDMYDIEWNHLSVTRGNHNQAGDIFEKPEKLRDLKFCCEALSRNKPFVRVDFNIWNNQIYFGELTFFDLGGFEKYFPDEWNMIFAKHLDLTTICRR